MWSCQVKLKKCQLWKIKILELVLELTLLHDQLPPSILSIFPFALYIEQWFSGGTEPIEWLYIIKGNALVWPIQYGLGSSTMAVFMLKKLGILVLTQPKKPMGLSSSKLALKAVWPTLEGWRSWGLTSVGRLWQLIDTVNQEEKPEVDRNLLPSPSLSFIWVTCPKVLPKTAALS